MRWISSIVVVIMVFVAVHAIAGPFQEEQGPPRYIYEAYYKINYADLPEWTALFYEHSVPVLDELQDEGILQGWSMYNHYTAGDYNVRFTARTWDWNALRQFWDNYLPRLAERSPKASERSSELILAHFDEIWDLDRLNVPPANGPYQYMVTASFQVNFGDLEAWNSAWSKHMTPVLDQAIEDGFLGGWAILAHNTGASENWRILYFFDEWDNIDDLFARLYFENDAVAIEGLDRMFTAHSDQIWTAATAPEPAQAGLGQ